MCVCACSRYLLSDGCIMLKKPLVSGSALRFEGQLTVYGWCGGPCYRCLFPSPPPPSSITNCSEGGVLGVGKDTQPVYRCVVVCVCVCVCVSVPGIIGSLQALEALKIASGIGGMRHTIFLRSFPPSSASVLFSEAASV